MPVATLTERQANLTRLSASLSAHCPPDARRASAAQKLAVQMPLSHATPYGNLQKILRNGALLSQVQLGRPFGRAEQILETTDDVFLYLGAFSYPGTECGFLFGPTVEAHHPDDNIATPFDSGALARMSFVKPPASYTNGVTFVREHELPVSDYRALLTTIISDYSRGADHYLQRPDDFACACGTSRNHPFGLSGGDRRAATFEVRIPQRVPLRPPHLRAVFVRRGFEPPELSDLFALGVSIERFDADDDADFFHALRAACVTFVQDHLIS
jgi:hypothetical protein